MHCRPAGDERLRNRPDETVIALRKDESGRDWLYTGDIARMDEDGYTYIVQRKKDMIIVSGFNVYPSEVEGVLYTHPDVLEVAVIGIPDSYRGEAVKACVVLKHGANVTVAELIAHCESGLAEFKAIHEEMVELLTEKEDIFLKEIVDYRQYNFRF